MGIMSGSSSVDTVNAGTAGVEQVNFGSVKVFAKTGKILCTVQFSSRGENGSCQMVIWDSNGNETYRKDSNLGAISTPLPGIGGSAWVNAWTDTQDIDWISYGVETPAGYIHSADSTFETYFTGRHQYWYGERYHVSGRTIYCRAQ